MLIICVFWRCIPCWRAPRAAWPPPAPAPRALSPPRCASPPRQTWPAAPCGAPRRRPRSRAAGWCAWAPARDALGGASKRIFPMGDR
eukprot:4415905-Pyramimonas_sp.AAC.1